MIALFFLATLICSRADGDVSENDKRYNSETSRIATEPVGTQMQCLNGTIKNVVLYTGIFFAWLTALIKVRDSLVQRINDPEDAPEERVAAVDYADQDLRLLLRFLRVPIILFRFAVWIVVQIITTLRLPGPAPTKDSSGQVQSEGPNASNSGTAPGSTQGQSEYVGADVGRQAKLPRNLKLRNWISHLKINRNVLGGKS